MTKAQVQLVLHRNGPEGNFLLLYLESSEVKKWNQYFYFYYSAYNSTRVKKAFTFATSGNTDEKTTNQEKKGASYQQISTFRFRERNSEKKGGAVQLYTCSSVKF